MSPPSVSEAFTAALGNAARKAGLDASDDQTTGALVWKAIGGVRGVLESVVPTVAFVATYTLWPGEGFAKLLPAVLVSVGIALIFSLVRLVMRQPVSAAFGGLVAAVVAATIALITGNAADTFVVGLITNLVYGTGILISVLVGWSAIGVIAGFLMGDATAWRQSKRKRRGFFWLGLAWAGLFFLRLAVQLPVYFASQGEGDNEGAVALLGTLKLVMGIPLFALLIAVTWFVVRRLYHRRVPATPAG